MTTSNRWSILFHEPSAIKTVVHSIVGVMARAEFQLKRLRKDDDSDNMYLCVDITDLSRVCCVSARLSIDEIKAVLPSNNFMKFRLSMTVSQY